MNRLALAVGLLAVLPAVASRADYDSVKRKFASIERKQVKPGQRVSIPSQELNAYVEAELPAVAPQGVRSPRVELPGGNVATGRALVNFLKLRKQQGKPNWLLRKLLDGEREVAVTVRVHSAGGTATIDVQRVEVAGVPIDGAALDFLIQNYLLPNYPEARIGKPIALKYNIDRIETTPGAAHVIMKR